MHLVNLHIYPSPFKFETRILKEVHSLIKLELASEIIILSIWEEGLLFKEQVSQGIRVVRLKPFFFSFSGSKVSKAFAYIEFYWRAAFFGFKEKVDIINCHSLMVLPLSAMIAAIKKSKLIYDPHELETERIGLHGMAQTISRKIERWLIKKCDAVIVVSESIQHWYSNTYKISKVYNVRNIPKLTPHIKSTILRENLRIPIDDLIFIYQGIIELGRNIESYLNVFSRLPMNLHLVIMGYGSLDGLVKDYEKKFPNIHFHPAVSPDDILKFTTGADVGLSLIENKCLSYYYCLPNKFFEYVMAGIPIIASDFPDMAELIKKYDIGWSVEVTEENLFSLIKSITNEELIAKRKNLEKMKPFFHWENEEKILLTVYKSIKI